MDLSVTSDRDAVGDFTTAIFENVNYLYMRRPEPDTAWTTFAGVFDQHFWMATFSVLLSATLILYFVLVVSCPSNSPSALDCFGRVGTAFFTQGSYAYPGTFSGRSATLTVLLTGALVLWCYNAGLTSTLTAVKTTFPIESMEDLAKNQDYRFG